MKGPDAAQRASMECQPRRCASSSAVPLAAADGPQDEAKLRHERIDCRLEPAGSSPLHTNDEPAGSAGAHVPDSQSATARPVAPLMRRQCPCRAFPLSQPRLKSEHRAPKSLAPVPVRPRPGGLSACLRCLCPRSSMRHPHSTVALFPSHAIHAPDSLMRIALDACVSCEARRTAAACSSVEGAHSPAAPSA
jgi:hypothetical protein